MSSDWQMDPKVLMFCCMFGGATSLAVAGCLFWFVTILSVWMTWCTIFNIWLLVNERMIIEWLSCLFPQQVICKMLFSHRKWRMFISRNLCKFVVHFTKDELKLFIKNFNIRQSVNNSIRKIMISVDFAFCNVWQFSRQQIPKRYRTSTFLGRIPIDGLDMTRTCNATIQLFPRIHLSIDRIPQLGIRNCNT